MSGVDRNRAWRKANARHWDVGRDGHLAEWYDLESFRSGHCSLRPLEVEALGDVAGKRLLHLQCNCGLDTLSWARRGAVVTGVDLSEESIGFARRLATEVDLPARFVCCDVMDLDDELPETFDVAFASYGVFCWIDDVPRWMEVAARRLAPGGRLFYADGHPALWPVEEAEGVEATYFHSAEPLVCPPEFDGDVTSYEWQWTIADIVNAAIRAGLQIEELGEHPFVATEGPGFVRDDEGWWRLPGATVLPLSLSLMARKPG